MLGAGYAVRPVEEHFLSPSSVSPVLLLRHDVDQAPRSALAMSAVEQRVGVRSSWYVRWRTADPALLRELRLRGGTIGLHYETLSRRTLAGVAPEAVPLDACREELKAEIGQFTERFGPIRSVCAHGDTRAPSVRNWTLLEATDPTEVGVELDLDQALRGARLGAWLSDRSRAEGGWKPGLDPTELIEGGVSPLLCLTHPNNWISGGALWRDRILAAALPAPSGKPVRVMRTGSDAPPGQAPR